MAYTSDGSRICDASRVALAAIDADFTLVTAKTVPVIYCAAIKGVAADRLRTLGGGFFTLQWRRAGGTFVDIESTTEVKIAQTTGATVLVHNTAVTATTARCNETATFIAGGLEIEAATTTTSSPVIDLRDVESGEWQIALDFSAALDNQQYEFRAVVEQDLGTNTIDYAAAITTPSLTTQYSVSAYTGYFDSPTVIGSQSVTGLGFTPKVVWFFGANHGLGGSDQDDHHKFMGAATSSSAQYAWGVEPIHAQSPSSCCVAHSNTHCVYVPATSGLRIIEADFTSLNTDGFTVNWGKIWTSPIRIYFLALGGPALQVAVGVSQALTVTGLQDVTTVGFQPDALICHGGFATSAIPVDAVNFASSGFVGFTTGASAQYLSGWRSNTGDLSQNCSTHQKSGSVVIGANVSGGGTFREAVLDSFLANGFRLNWTIVNTTAAYYSWIALKGINVKVGSFTATPDGSGNQAITGLGFPPAAVFLQSANKPASSTAQPHFRTSWGASDGTRKWSIWGGDRDHGVTELPSICATRADIDRVFRMGAENNTGPSVDTDAAIDTLTLTSDGMTPHFDITTTTGQEIQYLAFGSLGAAYVRLHPNADVSAGSWTSTGANFFSVLDEVTTDDADKITSAAVPTNDVAEVALQDPATNAAGVTTIRLRVKKT
jgi:hypothetical protein